MISWETQIKMQIVILQFKMYGLYEKRRISEDDYQHLNATLQTIWEMFNEGR